METIKEEIKNLKKARKLVLGSFDILLTEEEEKKFYIVLDNLNKLINSRIIEIEQLEKTL